MTRHLSYRAEMIYVSWIKSFIYFHGKRHLNEMRRAKGSGYILPEMTKKPHIKHFEKVKSMYDYDLKSGFERMDLLLH